MDIVSPPSFYLSAPTSPSGGTPKTIQFYSTQSSPVQQLGSIGSGPMLEWSNTHNDEFEFNYRLPARANSFSTIAFADELFCNGHVLPLKPPPRLQTSVPTSPRSFGSRVRNPFAQRSTWNDGFDPFLIALEKVSEEPEGRMSVHKRSCSYSPVRVNCGYDWDHGQEKEPTVFEMMDRKGSMYSRWVRSQTMVKKSPTARTVIKRLWTGHSEPGKPVNRNELGSCRESKMQKVKSVLSRYASVKKESSESESKQKREIITISKTNYLKRLSLSLKMNMRKKEKIDPKLYSKCL